MAESIHDSGGISMPYAMNPSAPDSPIIEELLAQADWLRNLAGQLVLDPHAAEDLAQETLIRAIEAPPAQLRHARAWLATVLRNLAAGRFRSESRRRQREERAAAPEALPSTGELVERAHLQRELAGLVLGLDERTREVLLLRFFEGLAPRHIAAQLELPVATVHTRIERGLAKLREKLDREYGERKDWVMAFAPLLPRAAAPPASTGGTTPAAAGAALRTGVLFVNAKILLTAATALVLAVLFQFWPQGQGLDLPSTETARSNPRSHDLDQADLSAREAPAALVHAGSQREELTTETEPAPPASFEPLTGLLVDELGLPLSGLPIRIDAPELERAERIWRVASKPDSRESSRALHSDPLAFALEKGVDPRSLDWLEYLLEHDGQVPEVLSGLDGTWSLPQPGAPLAADPPAMVLKRVRLGECPFIIVGAGCTAAAPGSLVVVAAPRVRLAGWVTDSTGRPLQAARVVPGNGLNQLRALPFELQATWSGRSGAATTDARGHFELLSTPAFEGNVFVVELDGYRSLSLPVPAEGRGDLRLVLESREPQQHPTLEGIVVSPDGVAVAGAEVVVDSNRTRSDADGHFRLELIGNHKAGALLIASKRGHQAATRFWGTLADDLETAVELRLGPAPLSISGRLVAPADKALESGWRGALTNATALGWSSQTLEEAAAPNDSIVAPLGVVGVTADGRFQFHGLLRKDYQLRLWNTHTGQVFDASPIAAGSTEVEVELPTPEAPSRIVGRVIDSSGATVEGAKMAVTLSIGSMLNTPSQVRLEETTTSADGSFELSVLNASLVGLQVSGPRIRSHSWPQVSELNTSQPVTLEVVGIYRFFVHLEAGDAADSFTVLDADDELMGVLTRGPLSSAYRSKVRRGETGFPTAEVDDTARTLVLFAQGVELRRAPLTPHRGPVETLEL